MPSIFIWKADSPNTSKKTIRFYSGSNWALEDNEFSSKSYMYLEQIVISESDNSVITFKSKDMPQDWTGSDLLEVSNVPYEIVKSDNYGVLERIGDWMRFIANDNIEFTEDSLKSEFIEIKKWINHKNKKQDIPKKQDIQNKSFKQEKYTKQYKPHTNQIDPQKVQLDFQQFLIKYNTTSLQSNNLLGINDKLNNLAKPKPKSYNSNTNMTKNKKFN